MRFVMPKERRKRNLLEKSTCDSVQRNLVAMKEIEGINPKLAKHALLRNDLMRDLTLDNYGSIQIMEQPVCRSCERPALWHVNSTAFCHVCGTVTQNPITVKQYLIDQFSKLTPMQLEALDILGAVDDFDSPLTSTAKVIEDENEVKVKPIILTA